MWYTLLQLPGPLWPCPGTNRVKKKHLYLSSPFLCVLARQCEQPPPYPYLGMDVIWPKKNKDLGARVNYRCPFRRGTETHVLKGKHFFIIALNKP